MAKIELRGVCKSFDGKLRKLRQISVFNFGFCWSVWLYNIQKSYASEDCTYKTQTHYINNFIFQNNTTFRFTKQITSESKVKECTVAVSNQSDG